MTDIADTAQHPTREALRCFTAGVSAVAERRAVVRHLLTDCELCRTRMEAPFGESLGDREAAEFRRSLERVRQTVSTEEQRLAEESVASAALLDQALTGDFEARRRRIEGDRRFHTWSLAEGLMQASREVGSSDAHESHVRALLAVVVTEQLDGSRYGERRIRDLQARAYTAVGTALRIQSDFRAAEVAFLKAKELLQEGTRDPMERAWVLLHEASVYGQQGRYDRAFALLDHVGRIARRFEDCHLQGKALLNKALFLSYSGEAEQAITLLYRGIDLLDAESEPRTLLVAWHNIFLCLSYLGRTEEALERLPHIRALHEELGSPLDLLRLRWVEGRLAAELGEEREAEEIFQSVREEFISAGIGYEAAQVSLDLASLWLQQGKTGEIARLAEEMLPIFKSRDVHRGAIAALIVFQKAAEMETVNRQLLGELEEYLRRARNNPSLRFQPS